MKNSRNLPIFNREILPDIEDAIQKFLASMPEDEFVLRARFEFSTTQLTIHIFLESN